MRTLICGSIAYDNIMVFPDHFKNHILPEKIHVLNVAFLVPEMRREFGGCAGNIAYNLKMLGGEPVMMATVGDDYAPYAARFEQLNLIQSHVQHVPDTFTAQAFITTDLDGESSPKSWLNDVRSIRPSPSLAVARSAAARSGSSPSVSIDTVSISRTPRFHSSTRSSSTKPRR